MPRLPGPQVSETLQPLSFCDCLFHSAQCPRAHHVDVRPSFLRLKTLHLVAGPHYVCSSLHRGQLGCFYVHNAPLSNAAGSTGVHVSLRDPAGSPFGFTAGGIGGSCGSSICNLWRKRHTVFYRGCSILPSHPRCDRLAFVPHPHAASCVPDTGMVMGVSSAPGFITHTQGVAAGPAP